MSRGRPTVATGGNARLIALRAKRTAAGREVRKSGKTRSGLPAGGRPFYNGGHDESGLVRRTPKKGDGGFMSSLSISCIVFACIFGGTVLGMVLRVFLPEKHLSAESREVVKLGMGLVGTMTALVLGLLIASAKGSFDIQRNGLAELSANIILLDRVLAHYGPESKDARDMLRASVADMLQHAWPQENPRSGQAETKVRTEGRYEGLYEKIRELAPKSDAQRALQAQALKTGIDIAQTALADVHTERQFDSDSVSGADGLLAHSHSRQLQPALRPPMRLSSAPCWSAHWRCPVRSF